MSYLIKLAILPALLALTTADFPFDVEELNIVTRNDDSSLTYRLPEDLDPIHYEVEVTPYFEEAPENRTPFSFDGRVTITLRAVADNVNALIIQENVREILALSLLQNGTGTPIPLNPFKPFERIREVHFLKINLADGVTLVNGDVYVLNIIYIGNINETPLSRGVFRGSYKDDSGKLHWYAATHLQPVNSRQAFPSFDEPGFKSTFDIIINRPAHFTETFSNMRIKESYPVGDRVREIFYTTPRMSAYLVSFHISEEFKVIADNNDPVKSYRIIARPNAPNQGEYALQVGPPITKWLDEYFNISYYEMEDGIKNDQIAVPDWASGATENWGLVSYREFRLLYQEGETNAADKMSIATITAHELAHKWFGNLITCRWWDNVWINEGFASYFEYFAMDGVDKDMELEDQFNIMYLQSALSSDSSASRPLQYTVNSPAEVTGHFSGISYTKGASLLLMLKHFLGENTFKRALNLFLTEMSYEHAFPSDLSRAFAQAVSENPQATAVDIEAFLDSWVNEAGYPVINVDVNMDTGLMSIKQERFFISASAAPTTQLYPLPLTYTSGNNPDWDDLTPKHLMTGESYEIQKEPGHEWVIFNVQQKGIYRVNYDTHNWEMLASALSEDYTKIHHLNRAQIVDDVFALMRAERLSYSLGFRVLEFLKQDTSYYSWYPAITGFNWLRNRFLHLPEILEQFDAVLFEYLENVIADLTYDVQPGEPLTRTLNRFYLLDFACRIGHQGCVDNAIQKYAAFRNQGQSIDPNLRRHVYCSGLNHGDYQDWLALYNKWQSSNNQAAGVQILRGLGCSTDQQAVNQYLNMILDDELVKAQDRVNAFTYLYIGSRDNAKTTLQWIKGHVDEIRKAVVLQSWFDSVFSNLAGYLDEEGLEDMEQWLQSSTIPEASVGLSAIASARANMQWGTERADMILTAARGAATGLFPSITLLLTVLLALMLK